MLPGMSQDARSQKEFSPIPNQQIRTLLTTVTRPLFILQRNG